MEIVNNIINLISNNINLFQNPAGAEEELLNNTIQATSEAFSSTSPSFQLSLKEIQEMTVEGDEYYRNNEQAPDPGICRLLAYNKIERSQSILTHTNDDEMINYPVNSNTESTIAETDLQPLKYGSLDFRADNGCINKRSLFALKMFKEGWYCYLTNILGHFNLGILHEYVKSRVAHFTPMYPL